MTVSTEEMPARAQYTFPIEQEIAPKKKRKVSIPLEDLELIICTGANIRLSTGKNYSKEN